MSLMLLRRRMMAAADHRPVGYLESTGTQYICLYPDDPAPEIGEYLQIEMDFLLTEEGGAEMGLFGAKPAPPATVYGPTFFYAKSYKQLRMWCDAGTVNSTGTAAAEVRYYASLKWLVDRGREFTVNDTSGSFGTSLNTYMTREESRHYCFFADGRSSTGHNGSHMRLYGAKIIIDGVLLNDLIPCIRLSDSRPAMYDKITKRFYTNIGTDEFVIPASS